MCPAQNIRVWTKLAYTLLYNCSLLLLFYFLKHCHFGKNIFSHVFYTRSDRRKTCIWVSTASIFIVIAEAEAICVICVIQSPDFVPSAVRADCTTTAPWIPTFTTTTTTTMTTDRGQGRRPVNDRQARSSTSTRRQRWRNILIGQDLQRRWQATEWVCRRVSSLSVYHCKLGFHERADSWVIGL
jgi:hypothetical protein